MGGEAGRGPKEWGRRRNLLSGYSARYSRVQKASMYFLTPPLTAASIVPEARGVGWEGGRGREGESDESHWRGAGIPPATKQTAPNKQSKKGRRECRPGG